MDRSNYARRSLLENRAGAWRGSRAGLSRIEVLVVLVIAGAILSCALWTALWLRTQSRRTTFFDNFRKVGVGIHAQYDSRQSFSGPDDQR